MVLVLATSLPMTTHAMFTPAVGKEEYGLRSAFDPEGYPETTHWFYWLGDISQNLAKWLDAQNLPDGSVVMDTFGMSRIWLFSSHPKQFVVRSDLDFLRKLNEPARSGVRFIISTRPTGLGLLDAVNLRYPTLWNDGAGIATLAMTIADPNGTPMFRIYQINR